MLQAVPTANLNRLRPLFADLPGLHGCLHAALEGAMGSVFADDAEQPTMALANLDFYLLGGDAGAADAEDRRGWTTAKEGVQIMRAKMRRLLFDPESLFQKNDDCVVERAPIGVSLLNETTVKPWRQPR